MATSTTICNMALGAIPAARIVAMAENSLQAKECRLHYPQVLGEILEESDWGFATVRTALAEMPANDREGEWSYCYQGPNDMAFPLTILDSSGLRDDFVFSGSFIYTNMPLAFAEYVSTRTLADQGNALFRRYVVMTLAARLCPPITKDLKRTQVLQQAAEVAGQRAKASNFNRNPHRYDDYVPDILKDRMGLDTSNLRRPPPETSYPEESFEQVFQEALLG